jgi:hypothetical protein
LVRVVTREYGGGSVQILAAGQDALVDPAVPDERVGLRARVLRWLYERARYDRYVSSRVAAIAADLKAEEMPVFAAARYLEQKGYAEVHRLGNRPGDPLVQITPRGQDAVDHPEQAPPSTSAQAMTHVVFNAPVGQSIVGGQGHTQNAQHIVVSPQTQDIVSVINTIRDVLRGDGAINPYVKDDAEHALKTLEGEVVKPVTDQDSGRIAHLLQRLKDYAPAALTLIGQLESLINNRPHL